MKSARWDEQHRQAAHEKIEGAVDKRLGLSESGLDSVRAGFLGYELDPVGNRLIMQLDPSLIDVAKFRVWVDGVARRANDAARVRGPKLGVTVQEGCFSAKEIAALISFPRENTDRNGMKWMISHVQLDGRIHVGFDDKAGALATQRRFGHVLAAHYPGGPHVQVPIRVDQPLPPRLLSLAGRSPRPRTSTRTSRPPRAGEGTSGPSRLRPAHPKEESPACTGRGTCPHTRPCGQRPVVGADLSFDDAHEPPTRRARLRERARCPN